MSAGRDVAIRVEKLSKRYRVFESARQQAWEAIAPRGRGLDFWALQDVSFEVARGEVVGVVGRNGAGKTTLLRIMSGTLDQTSGQVSFAGRATSILALGIGLNGELSGRENILLGCLYQGLTHAQAKEREAWIAAFSGLGEGLDRPLRDYSSGMQARLSFSIAFAGEPDILVIDEALAVGDGAFSATCFRRIREIAARGATVLFVSHDLHAVYALCTRAILLEKGRLVADAAPREIGLRYEQLIHETMAEHHGRERSVTTLAGRDSGDVPPTRIIGLTLLDELGDAASVIGCGQKVRLQIEIVCSRPYHSLSLGFRVHAEDGLVVAGSSTALLGLDISCPNAGSVRVEFAFASPLSPGRYFVSGGLSELLSSLKEYDNHSIVHILGDALILTVLADRRTDRVGLLDLNFESDRFGPSDRGLVREP